MALFPQFGVVREAPRAGATLCSGESRFRRDLRADFQESELNRGRLEAAVPWADGIDPNRFTRVWLKTRSPEFESFAWQKGYGAFSIGFSQLKSVRDYIARQEEHHRKTSFQDEFRRLLERYEIEYDERYVWA